MVGETGIDPSAAARALWLEKHPVAAVRNETGINADGRDDVQ